jgi:hypothetical protein
VPSPQGRRLAADDVFVDRALDGRPERRGTVDRIPLGDAARVGAVVSPGQARTLTHPASIVDVSLQGAGLRVPAVVELVPGGLIELGIDGAWSVVRVVWTRPGLHLDVVAGVEFTEAEPAFLPALARWMANYAAWRNEGVFSPLVL